MTNDPSKFSEDEVTLTDDEISSSQPAPSGLATTGGAAVDGADGTDGPDRDSDGSDADDDRGLRASDSDTEDGADAGAAVDGADGTDGPDRDSSDA